MKLPACVVLSCLSLASAVTFAAAAELRVTKTATIDAPPARVWDTIKDFDGWTAWHPAVAKDEIVAGTHNKVGAVRLLTLKGGGTVKEELLAYNDSTRSLSYRIVESVLPVSHYTSHLVVKADGAGRSKVIWSGTFTRKHTADNPPDAENDKAATDTVTGVYQSGLDSLKKLSEGK